MKRLGIALAVIAFVPALAWAHGGGLDKNGCHHDKKAGDYHCHKGELSGKHFKNEGEAVAALKGAGAQGEKMKSEKSHGAQGEKMKSDTAKEKEATPEKKGGKKKEAATR